MIGELSGRFVKIEDDIAEMKDHPTDMLLTGVYSGILGMLGVVILSWYSVYLWVKG